MGVTDPWPAIDADFTTFPYLHQLREFEISAQSPVRALLWQPRTGKSKLVIDTACHLYKAGLIDSVLVFAPNGVHENWIRRELPKHHWANIPRSELYWRTSIAGRKTEASQGWMNQADRANWQDLHDEWWALAPGKLAFDGLAWYSFASASMTRDDVRKLVQSILRHRKRVLVIFDESQDYRQPGSKRSKMARSIAKRCHYRRILTGTPVHNSPLHIYSQLSLLEPGWSGQSTFGDFKKRYARYEMERTRGGRQYPKLVEYTHLDELQSLIAPYASVVLRADCVDMPDLVFEERKVDPTEEQVRLYKELHREFELWLDSGEEITLGERTNRLIKMQQVMSGFIKDEFGDVTKLSANPRLEALREECSLGGRFIIWCQFRQDIDDVTEALRADGLTIMEYHGRTSDEDKARTREAFAPESDSQVDGLVGQAQSGGSGLDLSAADWIGWYSHTFDTIVREQAEERATAIGGNNVRVIDFMMPGTDYYMQEMRQDKLETAGMLSREGLKELIERTRI
jgi:SNF2 family DNA or RNA helicase